MGHMSFCSRVAGFGVEWGEMRMWVLEVINPRAKESKVVSNSDDGCDFAMGCSVKEGRAILKTRTLLSDVSFYVWNSERTFLKKLFLKKKPNGWEGEGVGVITNKNVSY